MHIHNRNDLINWLEKNAPYKAIARALQEGQVENLGAFSGSNFTGWIVKVTSKFNRVWYVKIQPIKEFHTYGTVLIKEVPWENWIGFTMNTKLYKGDKHKEYLLILDKSLLDRELRNGRQKR